MRDLHGATLNQAGECPSYRGSAVGRVLGLLGCVACVVLLNGCATITKGHSQAVTVNTNPPGARCTLTREGSQFAVADPTPQTLQVEKDKDPITVSCRKAGYEENIGVVASEFQAMTLGNVVFGGLIGVVVDAGSGAMNEYPPLITITLIPQEFPTRAERDVFFDTMKSDFLAESVRTMERISKMCDPGHSCESQMKAAEAARDARLLEIEKKRNLAKVAGQVN